MVEIQEAIISSADVSPWVKAVYVWMLRRTDNGTRQVALSCSSSDFSNLHTQEFAYGAHDMNSANGSTHIHRLFESFATEFGIVSHGGLFKMQSDGMLDFDSTAHGYTVWFAWDAYCREADVLVFPGWKVINAYHRYVCESLHLA